MDKRFSVPPRQSFDFFSAKRPLVELDRLTGSFYHQVWSQRVKAIWNCFDLIFHFVFCFDSIVSVKSSFNCGRGLRGGPGKLSGGKFLSALLDRTDVGHRADLDDRAVLKTGTLLRDFDRFVLVRDLEIEIAANRF